jgi:hypothetical protein
MSKKQAVQPRVEVRRLKAADFKDRRLEAAVARLSRAENEWRKAAGPEAVRAARRREAACLVRFERAWRRAFR